MKNKQGGFLELIILIIIFLFALKYSGLTLTDVFNWFGNTFRDVFR